MVSCVDRVNKTKVAAELLAAVMARQAYGPSDRSPFEVGALRIFKLLDERGFQGRRLGALAIAIEFRLTALARLLAAGGGRGFASPGPATGMTWLHVDLVRCAAREPLIDRDDQPAFDGDSFRRRLLAMTAVQGQA